MQAARSRSLSSLRTSALVLVFVAFSGNAVHASSNGASEDERRMQRSEHPSTHVMWETGLAALVAAAPDLATIDAAALDSAASDSAAFDSLEADSLDGSKALGVRPDSSISDTVRSRIAPIPIDTLRIRFEVGASTDLSNEQYYEVTEDTRQDSLIFGRRLVSTPESHVAAVMQATITGTQGRGAGFYQLRNDLSLGNLLQRDVLGGTWRDDFAPQWRLAFSENAEYRHDQTFDRDLEELRSEAGARLRRASLDETTFLELGVNGEVLRSSGAGSEFLLDRNAARTSISIERLPLFGDEWRFAYRFATRSYPDSTSRNHVEHGWEARWRHEIAGSSITIEGDAARRSTRDHPTTSRDDFWLESGAVENELRGAGAWVWRTRLEGEAYQYDRPDTELFFDYGLLRGRSGPVLSDSRWSFHFGPRAEALWSRQNRAEQYQEIAGFSEIEYLAGSAWWSVTPAAGWRAYSDVPANDPLGATSLHSDYAYYELTLIGDHPLNPNVRLHLFGSARYESHLDAAQNARSLYFSLDVRKLF